MGNAAGPSQHDPYTGDYTYEYDPQGDQTATNTNVQNAAGPSQHDYTYEYDPQGDQTATNTNVQNAADTKPQYQFDTRRRLSRRIATFQTAIPMVDERQTEAHKLKGIHK